jgi:hypothetical protein
VSVAGGPVFPAWSIAWTWKVCLPFFTLTVWGEVQGANPPASSLHRNPAIALASVPVNSKVAVFFRVFSFGPLVIWVCGEVQSSALAGSVGSQS